MKIKAQLFEIEIENEYKKKLKSLLIKGHDSWWHVIKSRVDMPRWIVNKILR